MVFWIDEGDIGNYRTGYSVDVKLAGTKVKAVIDKIREEDDRCKVILKCNESFPGFLLLRKAEATVITKDYQGLSVPNESIVTKDGKPGVYMLVSPTLSAHFSPTSAAPDGIFPSAPQTPPKPQSRRHLPATVFETFCPVRGRKLDEFSNFFIREIQRL